MRKTSGRCFGSSNSHFPAEKFKAITDAHEADDKKAAADARNKLASAFKTKAKSVNEKYIFPLDH